MYLPFRHDGNVKESMLNNPASNLLDSTSTGWPFGTSFSAQSASNPVFHHSGSIQGLHNVHGNYSMPTMPSSISSRNSGFGGLPSGGVHQPSGGLSSGRFASNNLPVALSQLSHGGIHGHAGMANRTGSGLSLTSNTGARITSSAAIMGGPAGVAAGGLGRTISIGGGQSVSGSSSRAGTGGIGIQGPGRPMSTIPQQGSTQMVSLLGNTFSSSVGAANSGQPMMGNGHQNPMGLTNDLNSNDTSPYDISEFPQLTSRPNSSGGPQGQLASIRKQGLGVNSLASQNQEFSIQNEDFPALQSSKGNVDFAVDLHPKDHHHENALALMQSHHYPVGRSAGFSLGGSYATHHHQQQQQEVRSSLSSTNAGASFAGSANSADLMHLHNSDLFPSSHNLSASYHSQVVPGLRSGVPTTIMPGIGSYDHLLQYHHGHSQFRHMPSVNPSSREHLLKSMHALQGAPDAFGLLGLLSVIRMSEPDLTTLALGIDLTTLGLNLNSRDNLYRTFASPWADGPAKGEPEYTLPQCYSQPVLRLQPGYFTKFQQETLFYIFYSMPNDAAQLHAANELYRRGWFYHKELRMWLMHVPNTEPLVKTTMHERGSYLYFDPNQWEIGQKDNYVLHYEMLEKKPQLSHTTEL
ncbi:probable NOT transcription complex subunit VIP2 isoform X2 [Cryptomeria japonica]|uniref:probable NOT transcription complex subunit VIP2 isoform X2 n=1 Tax=Cryptomeria japonica TaxID=3369 RepID=UPI0025ACF1F3|nr:probable NOT transcription complex subunit VIP2 isoform X2 [Cryptomeria japonica]